MESDLAMLAMYDTRRFIALCQEGTIHLVWRQQTLRLRPCFFLRLAGVLDGFISAEQPTLETDFLAVFWSKTGSVNLWVLNMGLALSASEFDVLLDLIRSAQQQLRAVPIGAAPLPLPCHWRSYQVAHAEDHVFSVN